MYGCYRGDLLSCTAQQQRLIFILLPPFQLKRRQTGLFMYVGENNSDGGFFLKKPHSCQIIESRPGRVSCGTGSVKNFPAGKT